jgi:hypothetical protein
MFHSSLLIPKSMKTSIFITLISLMALWSCQKEKAAEPEDALLSLSGTLSKMDYSTVFQYGTHFLECADTGFALKSSLIDLDQYAGGRVTISAKKIEGYPVDSGPVFLDVIAAKLMP